MKKIFFCFFFFFSLKISAQINVVVVDSASDFPLSGVIVQAFQFNGVTDSSGVISLVVNSDTAHFRFSLIGFIPCTKTFSQAATSDTVRLQPDNKELDIVTVTAIRTGSRIEDAGIKVEILGKEEMDEEASIIPGNVSGILGDLSVITIQRTSQLTANDAIRLQGLDARYTQLMRDGLPLFSGFSGSLGVLTIPPLDLKQIEIIKGSASTLYGGGAIAGLINFVSRGPEDKIQNTSTISYSSVNEISVNNFFSTAYHKTGLTLFTGVNTRSAKDLNDDGFTEIPDQKNINIHPRFFYRPNSKTEIIVGVNTIIDHRKSGDIIALEKPSSVHSFLSKEKTMRNVAELSVERKINTKTNFYIHSATGFFHRNSNYGSAGFVADQVNGYHEGGFHLKLQKHNLIAGVNYINEIITPEQNNNGFKKSVGETYGIFIQDDFALLPVLIFQPGLRVDYRNTDKGILLPRLSVLWKATNHFTFRIASGSGYKVPSIYDYIDPVTVSNFYYNEAKRERSTSYNCDINFRTLLNNRIGIQINQAFYKTDVSNLAKIENAGNVSTLKSSPDKLNSIGTDTYVRLNLDEWEWYVGYNHTLSRSKNALNMYQFTPFNPINKFSSTLTYEIENKWRFGGEASYVADQYIENDVRVPNYWFFACMVELKVKKSSIVLNCENLLDKRQAQFGPLVGGTVLNPTFNPVWGPMEGRILNLTWKFKI